MLNQRETINARVLTKFHDLLFNRSMKIHVKHERQDLERKVNNNNENNEKQVTLLNHGS